MLANINMNGNSLVDVYKANGSILNVMNNLKVSGLAGKKMSFADSKISGVFSIENTMPFVNDEPMKVVSDSIDISSLQVDNAEFFKILFDPGDLKSEQLVSDNIVIEGELSVVPSNTESGESSWNFGASDVVADNLYSAGSVSNVFSNIVLKDDEDGFESYIYDGTVSLTGEFTDASSKINLSGVSEVYDICTLNSSGSYTCLSDYIKNYRKKLVDLWNKYCEKGGGC